MWTTQRQLLVRSAHLIGICALLFAALPPGHAQQTKPAEPSKPPYDKVYALCIGINEYATPVAGSDLRWAVNDATELDKIFRNRYGYDSKLLVREQASRKGIMEALDERFAIAGPEDVLIIYFAGHGRTVAVANPGENKDTFDGYLLPQDLKVTTETELKEEPYKTGAINMRLLAERLKDPKQVKAKHALLILDCCASGMAASSRGAGLRVDPGYVKSLASQRTRQIISAGQGDQKSYEYGNNGPQHGIFTAKLIDLLQAYPVRTIVSIFPKLQEDVFNEIQKLHGDRVIPQRKLLIDEGGDYVFIEKGVQLDWNREVEKSVSDGRSRGYEPTTDAEVKEAQVAAKDSETDRSADADWQKKTTEYEKRAAAGDANAQEAVVYCHQGGLGVPRDDRKAYHWARESNDNGNKNGRALTAFFIKNGAADDVPPESRDAISNQLLAGVPKEVADNLRGFDTLIAASAGKKRKNGIPNIGGKKEAGFIGDVGDFFSGLGSEGKKNFRARLATIETELNVPRGTPIKWQRVKDELNGWRGDIAKAPAASAEQRTSLEALEKVVNDMQLKTRTLDKTFILSKIKDAKLALDKVEPPGAK